MFPPVIRARAVASVVVAIGLYPSPPTAASATDDVVQVPVTLRESIAKAAALLPGMGQPDVYYPSALQGLWRMTQTYSDVAEKEPTTRFVGLLQQLRSKQGTPAAVTLSFDVNLIVRDGGNVVLDRSFSESNKWTAAAAAAATARWEPTNPNILTLTTPDALVVEEKVTKRAVESGLAEGSLGCVLWPA